MADEQLTDEQAISLLSKMDVEQKTLRELWGQFSGAIQQVGKVLQRYNDVKKELPELIKQRSVLVQDIAKLGPELEANKKAHLIQETQFRESLERELIPLREAVSQAREQVKVANRDVEESEKNKKARLEENEKAIRDSDSRFSKMKNDFDAWKKKHGLEAP